MAQIADTVLMVEPMDFQFNPETAENNYFQTEEDLNHPQRKALAEFRSMVELLEQHGIQVLVVKDTLDPFTPDSIFPNNWFSTHADGRLIYYPMYAENRRAERLADLPQILENAGFRISRKLDYSGFEDSNVFLEGTGSMILDHDNCIAYAAISERTDLELFNRFCEENGYRAVAFHAYQTYADLRLPIYHTNVMMCLAEQFAVICLDSIDDMAEREMIMECLTQSGKKIIEITEEQVYRFAGNMLQLRNGNGERFLVMSNSAYRSLTDEQIAELEEYNTILHPEIETIETLGGGSVRCMLAEIFLQRI